MHPFIEWIDAGRRPPSMDSYSSAQDWLEAADVDVRGSSIGEFLEWHRSRPSIYKDFIVLETSHDYV